VIGLTVLVGPYHTQDSSLSL